MNHFTRSLSALVVLTASLTLAQPVVRWARETSPIPSNVAGDPGIAVRADVRDGGVEQLVAIVGTDTVQSGVYVYNLDGTFAQQVLLGPVAAAAAAGELVVISNPNSGVQSFVLTPTGLSRAVPPTEAVSLAGPLALLQIEEARYDLWVDTRSTMLQHYEIARDAGALTFSRLSPLVLAQGASGIAVDPRTAQLYVAQPSVGILRINTAQGLNTSEFVASIDGGELGAVVGGLAVVPLADGGAWLFSAVASGDRVAVHELDALNGTNFLGSFAIGAPDGGAQRVRAPAHLDVSLVATAAFPRGFLVVQDGFAANYKIVDLAALADVGLALPPTWPSDAGAPNDAGAPDAGVDAGVVDAGVRDGGSSTGGGTSRPPPSAEPRLQGCGCTGPSILVLPLVLLWWIRRPRS